MTAKSIYFAPYQVPVVEPATGLMSKPWYLFFQALFARVGGSTGASNDDLQQFAAEDLDSAAIDAAVHGAQIQDVQGLAFDSDLSGAPSSQDVADALLLAHAALDEVITPRGTVTSVGLSPGSATLVVGSPNPVTSAGNIPIDLSGTAKTQLTAGGTALQPIAGLSGSYTYVALTVNAAGQITAVGSGTAPVAPPTPANPTASLGLAAINGVASTYLRSDAAPALNVGIAPTWTSAHTFSALVTANLGLTVAGGNFTSRGISDLAASNVLTVAATGGISILAPSSGSAISATGGANVAVVNVLGAATSGQSLGASIRAGTTSADYALLVQNQPASVNYLRVYGDGGAAVGTPTGGSQGVGSINAQALFQQGAPVYAGLPQNIQFGATYTFALTDANKHVYQNAGGTHTYTIPANATIAFPIGTQILLINGVGAGVLTLAITTDTLNWMPSGATGSRSLSNGGCCTLLKVGATTWYLISGVGVT